MAGTSRSGPASVVAGGGRCPAWRPRAPRWLRTVTRLVTWDARAPRRPPLPRCPRPPPSIPPAPAARAPGAPGRWDSVRCVPLVLKGTGTSRAPRPAAGAPRRGKQRGTGNSGGGEGASPAGGGRERGRGGPAAGRRGGQARARRRRTKSGGREGAGAPQRHRSGGPGHRCRYVRAGGGGRGAGAGAVPRTPYGTCPGRRRRGPTAAFVIAFVWRRAHGPGAAALKATAPHRHRRGSAAGGAGWGALPGARGHGASPGCCTVGRSVGALRDVLLAPPCAADPDTKGRVRVVSGDGVGVRGRPSERGAGAAGPAVTPLPGELAALGWERRGRGYGRARGAGTEPAAGGSGMAEPPGRAAPPTVPEPGSARADGTGRERWRAANFVLGGAREPPPPAPRRGSGTAIPSVSELWWPLRGHGPPARRGRWLPDTGAEGAGSARLVQEGVVPYECWFCQDEGWASTVPQVRGAVLPGDAIQGFQECRQPPTLEVPGTDKPLYGLRVPLRMCCLSPSPSLWCLVWKVPAGSHRVLATRLLLRVRTWNWKQ